MNAADYLYEQLMDAHQRIRELEEELKNLELHYQLTNIEPIGNVNAVGPAKRQKNEQSNNN